MDQLDCKSKNCLYILQSDKDPKLTLERAEELIKKSVVNVLAHQMLVDAAKGLEMKQTVVFGLETIRQIVPKDLKNLKELGNAYLEIGDTEKTIAIGNEIQKVKSTAFQSLSVLMAAMVFARQPLSPLPPIRPMSVCLCLLTASTSNVNLFVPGRHPTSTFHRSH